MNESDRCPEINVDEEAASLLDQIARADGDLDPETLRSFVAEADFLEFIRERNIIGNPEAMGILSLLGHSRSDIACLISHKCSAETHRISLAIRETFENRGIALQIDPFSVGDNADVRMQTFDIEALVFLLSPESIASQPAQLELKSARRQRLPIFIIHLGGPVPTQMKRFTYWKIPPIESTQFVEGIENLEAAIRRRVAFRRLLRLLYGSNTFHELIDTAQRIALDGEPALLAESACQLALSYNKISNPNVRYWIALALGRAGTPKATRLLSKLPSNDHPLVLEGIRQAKEMFRRNARLDNE